MFLLILTITQFNFVLSFPSNSLRIKSFKQSSNSFLFISTPFFHYTFNSLQSRCPQTWYQTLCCMYLGVQCLSLPDTLGFNWLREWKERKMISLRIPFGLLLFVWFNIISFSFLM
uniref:Uncharacterized protein n=1 Tax=Kalanchoe fedtschenkoi TaxID=63787 RepID=A0A7N0TFG8_KALFE